MAVLFMSLDPNRPPLPWYREFWFWFVFGPLIFIIVLCAFTVTIALKGADDVVVDNYYKEGQMINQVLEQDKRAEAMGLVGDLRFDKLTGDVMLTIAHAPEDAELMPEQLLLFMAHPVKATQDQQIMLKRIAPGEYRGALDQEPQFNWYLTLYPVKDLAERKSAVWILNGQIDFAQEQQTLLKPRVK